jgi:uncharacterized Zn finger protein
MSMHKTWWGVEFVSALEGFIDPGRLQRGKAYRTDNRVLKYDIGGSTVTATIRGNKNPYFGVTKEPKYKVVLKFKVISIKAWQEIIQRLCKNAGWLSKLMLNEIPKDIQQAFGQHCFLPASFKDIEASCSCPDYANPCKHIAGVYYKIAHILDSNPMLLFPLRGLQADELHNELKKSELGKAFVEHLTIPEDIEMEYAQHLFSPIITSEKIKQATQEQFWNMPQWDLDKQSTDNIEDICASLIKKQGDYPAFWDRPNSFINAMEYFYSHTKQKNKRML